MRSERILRMLPLNVVMVARIVGNVDTEQLRSVLDKLRKRHALLAVRLEVDESDVAWHKTKGVPELMVNVITRKSDDDCSNGATGPLDLTPITDHKTFVTSRRTLNIEWFFSVPVSQFSIK